MMIGELVVRCRQGDRQAWDEIVRRLTPLMWSIARSYGLGTPDCEDVVQTSWMRVLDHLETIEAPAKLPSWIGTITRREAVRHIHGLRRHTPVGDSAILDRTDDAGSRAEERMVRREQGQQVLEAYRRLPPRCQELLGLLMRDPAPSYDEVSATLGLPRGSIGPTRSRCLARLQRLLSSDAPPATLRLPCLEGRAGTAPGPRGRVLTQCPRSAG